MRKVAWRHWFAVLTAVPAAASAQVPDLLSALDIGGRAMGYGGGSYVTDSNTISAYANPAGLAYVGDTDFGFVMRNLPESSTSLTGSFRNPTQDTTGERGAFAVTHLGYATRLKGRGGIGVAFTTGGFIRDTQTGNGLDDGNVVIRDYINITQVKSDFFTISYGQSDGRRGLSYGVGLVVATVGVMNKSRGSQLDDAGNFIGTIDVDNSSLGVGVGGVIGLMYVPTHNPNMSFGLSFRTPIDLGNNSSTAAYLDRLPAKLSGGVAFRRDGLRGGRDFWVFALEADAYIGGQTNKLISRKNEVVVGSGFEYNYQMGSTRIPIRVGYQLAPGAGTGFQARDSVTFGVGYRPNNAKFAIDLNFASPTRGGQIDMALCITYRK